MKKLLAVFLSIFVILGLTGCNNDSESTTAREAHAAFVATADGTEVTVTGYVAAKQSWWENKATIYLLDINGEGYFIYELSCTEENYNSELAIGNKISVTGIKSSWAGQIEILGQEGSGATYKVETGTKTDFKPIELAISGITESTIGSYFTTKDVEVSAAATFQNPDTQSGDIYFTVKDSSGNTLACCIESYLTDSSTDVYKTAAALVVGDKITITGYVYWYNAANPHITIISK